MAEPFDEFDTVSSPAAGRENPFLKYVQPTSADNNPFLKYVQKPADPFKDAAKQFLAGIPRGVAQAADLAPYLTLPGIISKGIKKATGIPDPSAVETFDASPLNPGAPETRAGEYAQTIGETVGGSIMPGGATIGIAKGVAKTAVANPAKAWLGRKAQEYATTIAANPVRAAAYDLAGAVSGGTLQHAAKEAGAGPLGQTVATIVGGSAVALPSAAAGMFNRVQAARSAQGVTGAYNRMGKQLPEGDIDTFANHVAKGATSFDLDTQRRTFDVLGEEMMRAGQDRVAAQKSAIARMVREDGITEATAKDRIRNLTAVHRDSPLLLSEYGQAMPTDAAIGARRKADKVDLGEIARPVDDAGVQIVNYLANRPGQAAVNIRNAVNERNAGMRDTARKALENLAPRAPGSKNKPGKPLTIEDLDQMQEGARRAASLDYDAAYKAPTDNQILLQELPLVLERHATRAAGRNGAPYTALRDAVNEFTIEGQGGQRVAMQTLQMLQDARGSVRDTLTAARKADNRQIVNTLQPLYRDITDLMERANPVWAKANRAWADNSIEDAARDIGAAFAQKASPKYREQIKQFRVMRPEGQDMVRVEYLKQLFDKLDNLPDGHDVAKLLNTDHTRNAIKHLFGSEKAIEVAKLTRDAAIATRSGGAIGNSATHMRGEFKKEFDADTGIMAAAKDLNVRELRNQLWEKLTGVFTERRNRPLAEIASTPMADVAQVAKHVHGMRDARKHVDRIENARPVPAAPRVINSTVGATTTAENPNETRRRPWFGDAWAAWRR